VQANYDRFRAANMQLRIQSIAEKARLIREIRSDKRDRIANVTNPDGYTEKPEFSIEESFVEIE
jgi:hypothetical protein